MKNEKQEVKTTPLNEVEKPKIPALTGLEGQGKTLMASQVLQSLGIETETTTPLNFVEKWSDLEIALRGQIVESYGIPALQTVKAFSLQTLRFLSEELEAQQLCEATEQFGVFAFSNFLTVLGVLGHQEEVWEAIEEVSEGQTDNGEEWDIIDFVNEWLDEESLDEVKKICDLLMSSKEDIINDFVVPHYKVGKASHLWLEELTESALNRAIDRHFDEVNHFNEVFDSVKYGFFTDADHVSIFEYVLEGQDLQAHDNEVVKVKMSNQFCEAEWEISRRAFNLLKGLKPLEASEIPSLMEAFPFGETTELPHWYRNGETVEVPNEKIHETLLKQSRHSAFFNSYGISLFSADDLKKVIGTWRVSNDEVIDNGDFNDTDGVCLILAAFGFAKVVFGVASQREADLLWDNFDEGRTFVLWDGEDFFRNPSDNFVVVLSEGGNN